MFLLIPYARHTALGYRSIHNTVPQVDDRPYPVPPVEGGGISRLRCPLPVLRPLHGGAPPRAPPGQVLVGLTDGTARLFLITSGELVAQLQCQGEVGLVIVLLLLSCFLLLLLSRGLEEPCCEATWVTAW